MKEPAKSTAVPLSKPLHANAYPKDGYSMVVDGRFKQHFATLDDAQKASVSLKIRFPSLQIVVRDAISGERTAVNLPE